MVLLREAKAEEEDIAMEFIDQAKMYLKSQGIDQWQSGYPDLECIREDITRGRGYFIINDNSLSGYLCVDFSGEPVYEDLIGAWKSSGAYGVVHRLAISGRYRGQGMADVVFGLVEELCRAKGIYSIKVDTDVDNHRMQHILHKNGFEYCGTVLYDGSERIAFEKVLKDAAGFAVEV